MLGVKAITTVATEKNGIDRLMKSVLKVPDHTFQHYKEKLHYDEEIETSINELEQKIKQYPKFTAEKYPLRWFVIKLLEGDRHIFQTMKKFDENFSINVAVSRLTQIYGDDVESIVTSLRYAKAAETTHRVLVKPRIKKGEVTEKIDGIILNKYLGVPIFLALMWFVFKITFDISTPLVDWIDVVISGPVDKWIVIGLITMNSPQWLISLISEGVIAGVGFVIMFVPVIFTMMLFITFLEGSGYMARAAFVMDRAMRMIGLHGKSFIPMILGFGCNVPAICATRILENSKDRILTALLIPFMSCGARLPVYALFIGVFFTAHSGTILWSLYVMGIVLAVVVGIVLKKTLLRGESSSFIMELPPYRMPSFKNLFVYTWERGKHFLVKAGTYILFVSILVWFLLNLPWDVEQKKDSYLGKVGQEVSVVFQPLGFGNWEAAASLITGIIAKEIVVGTMSEIYAENKEEKAAKEKIRETFIQDIKYSGFSLVKALKDSASNLFSPFRVLSISDNKNESKPTLLRKKLQETFTPLSAYAFLTYVLLYMPCIVAALAMKNEFGSWKWVFISFGYQGVLGWVVAFIIYQTGSLFV